MSAELGAPETDAERVRAAVRSRYAEIAKTDGCCGSATSGCGCGPECCSSGDASLSPSAGGYALEQLRDVPEGANLGLGCGNPTALLGLRPGEIVLDLGSGGGVDVFLAAQRVGPGGRAIGVDMTPEMVLRARASARESGRMNVEFRLGELEHLPVADRSVDVVLSNCVINLVPDKGAVYREAFRVLRPGGRLAVSDMIATGPIPPGTRQDLEQWGSCSSGALTAEENRALLEAAGFSDVALTVRRFDLPASDPAVPVAPADIVARRPVG